jgi:hypothetical protein
LNHLVHGQRSLVNKPVRAWHSAWVGGKKQEPHDRSRLQDQTHFHDVSTLSTLTTRTLDPSYLVGFDRLKNGQSRLASLSGGMLLGHCQLCNQLTLYTPRAESQITLSFVYLVGVRVQRSVGHCLNVKT